jgi:hypothetical protein
MFMLKKLKDILGKFTVKKIGLYLTILHCIGFVITAVYIYFSTDPWASLMWMVFAIIDFPVSLLYYFYFHFNIDTENLPLFFAVLLYPPHIIHGLIGGIWWYYLPRLIWGKKIKTPNK